MDEIDKVWPPRPSADAIKPQPAAVTPGNIYSTFPTCVGDAEIAILTRVKVDSAEAFQECLDEFRHVAESRGLRYDHLLIALGAGVAPDSLGTAVSMLSHGVDPRQLFVDDKGQIGAVKYPYEVDYVKEFDREQAWAEAQWLNGQLPAGQKPN